MPRLIVIKGVDEGQEFELDTPVATIGRDRGSQIWLHDTEVSRHHAEFRQTETGYLLVDVGSVNGTIVNDQRVDQAVLRSGDRIQIGQSFLVYSAIRSAGDSATDLAGRISLIAQADLTPAAIIKTIGEAEGRRMLSEPLQAGDPWLQSALANLRVLYEVSHSISHIIDIDQLLERIMDLVFRSIEADRGCIMLRNPDTGSFEPKAARWRNGLVNEHKIGISRTIMDYVLRDRQGVLVSDAAHDDRFSGGQSIVRYGIREAICVPMKGRHETLGVLYLDTQLNPRNGGAEQHSPEKLSEDHLKLAIAIAHQAALAVEDTRYRQALLQAERLAAIGQAIAALSHHIKNILQGLRSGSDILKMGLQDKDEGLLQQGWRIVDKNQGRILDLVMDMLSYSKEREPVVESIAVNELVGDVLELVGGRVRELGVALEFRPGPDIPAVMADPEGLHRAVLNVVSNALDALENNQAPRLAVSTVLEPDGEWVRIVVVDNGMGIPPGKIADIFKPFMSTKGAKGTGLGLAVSRKILREHGGDILVSSRPGQGTEFALRVPRGSSLGKEANMTRCDLTLLPPGSD